MDTSCHSLGSEGPGQELFLFHEMMLTFSSRKHQTLYEFVSSYSSLLGSLEVLSCHLITIQVHLQPSGAIESL